MAEYIEREALIEDLDAAAKHGGMGAIIAQTLQRYVKRAPAADVALVRHGRWVSDEADVLFHCSKCGVQVSTSWDYDDLRWDYCPNCGARMDGGT